MRNTNRALLTKVGGTKLSMPTSLCSQILSEKYGQWEHIGVQPQAAAASATWRGVLLHIELLRSEIKWTIRNGWQASFWRDSWLQEDPLLTFAVIDIPNQELVEPVLTYWDYASGWRWELLRHRFPTHILTRLASTTLNLDNHDLDVPCWRLSSVGHFSVKSVKTVLSSTPTTSSDDRWQDVWKYKGPSRASFTLWQGFHGVLMTNAFLFHRRVSASPACDWCSHSYQTDLHLLLDCPATLQVWKTHVPAAWWDLFCRSVNIVHWFNTNWDLGRNNDSPFRNWHFLFRQTMHELWYSLNHRRHRNRELLNTRALVEKSHHIAMELLSIGVGG